MIASLVKEGPCPAIATACHDPPGWTKATSKQSDREIAKGQRNALSSEVRGGGE
jgi:hypothetical protein